MKKIKLNEKSYNKLKDKLVNEVTYGTLYKAHHKSSNLFEGLIDSFQEFLKELDYAIYVDRSNGELRETNPYLLKIKKLSDSISSILNRKMNQNDRFADSMDSIDSKKFYDSGDSKSEMKDFDFNYLRKNFGK